MVDLKRYRAGHASQGVRKIGLEIVCDSGYKNGFGARRKVDERSAVTGRQNRIAGKLVRCGCGRPDANFPFAGNGGVFNDIMALVAIADASRERLKSRRRATKGERAGPGGRGCLFYPISQHLPRSP